MKHVMANELGAPQAKRFHGHHYVQLPGGPQLRCKSQTDAQLLCDLINRLAVEFEDAKDTSK